MRSVDLLEDDERPAIGGFGLADLALGSMILSVALEIAMTSLFAAAGRMR